MSWTERAAYGVYGVALDHADTGGKKNRFMDLVHRTAIEQALRAGGGHYRRALDFGCGGGRLLPLLTRFAAEVYGVGRTPACLEMARTQTSVPPERLLCWRDGPLPFADGFFDCLLCVYVLLTTDALHALTLEMGRVCARGATAIVLEQADNGRGLTLAEYREHFAAAGLSIVDARAIRQSAGSRAMRLATRTWAGPGLAALAARWELARMRRRHHGPATPGYYDYLFRLRKTGGD